MTAFPIGLALIGPTATPTAARVQAAERFQVLDKRRAGLGVTGNSRGAQGKLGDAPQRHPPLAGGAMACVLGRRGGRHGY